MSAVVQRIAGERLEGPAITMHVVPDESASLTEQGLKAIRVFETAPAGSVIVVCLDGDPDYAVFGPTFATLSKSRGLGGIVTNGAMRGAADLRRIGVPVFSRGTVPGSAGGHYRIESVGEVIECAGARVAPGDVIVGDADGVAVIPRASAGQAMQVAQRLRDEKEVLLPLIARYHSYTRAVEEAARRSHNRGIP